MHMPAYQWVIHEDFELGSFSRLHLRLRWLTVEFLETYNNVQLRLNDKNEIDTSYDLLDGVTLSRSRTLP